MKIARLFGACLLALSGVLLVAGPASAHTELKSSSPAEGASLAAPPRKVELTFEEPVTLQPDPISVTGPDGAKWSVGTPTVVDAVITAPVTASGPAGAYTLTYKVVSDDGDKVTAAVHFTLTAPVSSSAAAATSSAAVPTGAPSVTQTQTPAPASDVASGVPAWVWILVAVVVVLAAAVVALRLLRRPRP
ncbi:copper resistance CopC family protein [Amycolatopsis sp. Hca4]|uniref:copper resistance CopC family protein n=1 Tax=Amycolatopsis sp. Hca4 TaxID=2742131 RepID=UPI001590D5A5|nr:copper resistance CopC family protein [Amycolatopsis sp. Hca4]QKV73443.1 copper resistance protein CopC [Amycolatopsis sp. Hca4]